MYRSIRNALTPKKIAALALFSIIGSNAYAQSVTGLSDLIKTLSWTEVWGSAYEPPFEGHYEQGEGWEWVQRDNDSSSGTYGQDIPVDAPPPTLTCPEIAERMAELDCAHHQYEGANGCGSGIVGQLVPDTIPGTPISAAAACNTHDLCYGRLGAQKEDCDVAFGDEIGAQCVSPSGRQQIRDTCNQEIDAGTMSLNQHDCIVHKTEMCNGTALIYQGAVQAYGFTPFYNGQLIAACAALTDLKISSTCP